MKGTSSFSYFPAAALFGKSEQKLTAKKTINVHAVISQGLCANKAENTIVFLCEATTANVCQWLWPFCKLPVITGKSTSPSQSGPAYAY